MAVTVATAVMAVTVATVVISDLLGVAVMQADRHQRAVRRHFVEIAEAVASETRTAIMQAYLNHLDHGISHSLLDADDRPYASYEDRQGLGLSRHGRPSPSPPTAPELQRAG